VLNFLELFVPQGRHEVIGDPNIEREKGILCPQLYYTSFVVPSFFFVLSYITCFGDAQNDTTLSAELFGCGQG
jgi:hypothetical protein